MASSTNLRRLKLRYAEKAPVFHPFNADLRSRKLPRASKIDTFEQTRSALAEARGILQKETVFEMTLQYLHDYCTLPSGTQLNAIVKGRNPLDGYSRGWGLQFGGLKEKILADPIYRHAIALAQGRTIQAELCRMNLFLIVRFYLPKLASGDIIEFGSYRGGSAIFLAATAKAVGLDSHVWALDTFEGMPETDPTIDLHKKGDFRDVDYDELVQFARNAGLDNLTFVRGRFEDTMPSLIRKTKPIGLAHIDCDIYSAIAYSYESVRNHMIDGGYIALDDAHYSSCLGATEAVEDLVIRRDGKNCEQIFPHFVFRQWNGR